MRRLIVASALVTAALFVTGFLFDGLGGPQFYADWPFVTSIPRDLFKLSLLGTLGVILLSDWRAQVERWPVLEAKTKTTVRAVHSVATVLGRSLGFADATLRAPTTLDAEMQTLRDVASALNAASEVDIRDESDPNAALHAALALESRWHRYEGSEWPELNADSIRTTAQRSVDLLEDIATSASPGTAASLHDAAERLRVFPAELDALHCALRAVSSGGTVDSFAIKNGLMALSATIHVAATALERLTYEAMTGSPYPGRRDEATFPW